MDFSLPPSSSSPAMSTGTLLICSGSKVLLPGADVPQPATIVVDKSTGKITHVLPDQFSLDELRAKAPELDLTLDSDFDINYVDAGDKVVLPGLVDSHVHLNEPGRTEWEGFWTGTLAAASGGVTTIIDMPLNSIPPTTTVSNLETKREAAYGQCHVDVGFWGGLIPGNQDDLKPLMDEGVKGFKCFLIESGVDEFPCVEEKDVNLAMQVLQDAPNTVLLFHAELAQEQPPHAECSHPEDRTRYATFLDSRPQKLETDAINFIIELQRKYPSLRCHIVHLSAASALPILRSAKRAGVKLTVETCFHYLCLSSNDIPDGRPEFKCCPPIRDSNNRDTLWDGLKDGTIDFVVSDHSPCVAELKKLDDGDVLGAWGGISTLGLGLSLLWTEAQKRGVSLGKIVEWTCCRTAEHAGLGSVKGQLQVGYDGDFVLWDADATYQVSNEQLGFRNKVTPYSGLTLRGVVEQTYLRGQIVYDRSGGEVYMATGQFV